MDGNDITYTVDNLTNRYTSVADAWTKIPKKVAKDGLGKREIGMVSPDFLSMVSPDFLKFNVVSSSAGGLSKSYKGGPFCGLMTFIL